MKKPNKRYANPVEFDYWRIAYPDDVLAEVLMRDRKTISNWINRKKKIPYWVPELLRLWDGERQQRLNFLRCRGIECVDLVHAGNVKKLQKRFGKPVNQPGNEAEACDPTDHEEPENHVQIRRLRLVA